jgi:hypothetical protein
VNTPPVFQGCLPLGTAAGGRALWFGRLTKGVELLALVIYT